MARGDDAPPFPGVVTYCRGRQDYLPVKRPIVVCGEDASPFAGAVAVGRYGFGDPRRTNRPTIATEQAELPFAGAVIAGKPPPPDFTAQQLATRPVVARGPDAEPFGGTVLTHRGQLVPSDRLPPRAFVARPVDPIPVGGVLVRIGRAHEVRLPRSVVAFQVQASAPGSVIVGKPPPPNLTPQQLPGRVVVVRAELIRDVLGGRVIVFPANAVLSGGAVPPVVATTRPGGAVRRADIQSRSVKRDPRMNGVTLAYMTKTKTPAEALSLVFDYSNWPEIVGGAKVLSAVSAGAGGVPA